MLTDHGLTLGRFSVSPGALFAGAVLLYLGPSPVQAACLTAAALHESGHLLTCLALGISVQSLRLTVLGAVLEAEARCSSGWEEVLVALAGPLVNLCTLPFALRAGARLLAGASVLLGVFNLLPVSPLDGSRVLHGLLSLGGELDAADEWTAWASRLGMGLLLVPGVVLGVLGNRSLLLVALWLLLRNHRRRRSKKGREGAVWRPFRGGLCL